MAVSTFFLIGGGVIMAGMLVMLVGVVMDFIDNRKAA